MKVGDLVVYKKPFMSRERAPGLIVGAGVYVGRKDVMVLWPNLNEVCTENSKHLRLINENR